MAVVIVSNWRIRLLMVKISILVTFLLLFACSTSSTLTPASDVESKLQKYMKSSNKYLVVRTVDNTYIALPSSAVTSINKNKITIAPGTTVAHGSYTKSGNEEKLKDNGVKNKHNKAK